MCSLALQTHWQAARCCHTDLWLCQQWALVYSGGNSCPQLEGNLTGEAWGHAILRNTDQGHSSGVL